MTVGFAPATAQSMLDSLTGLFSKLHTADPGVGATAAAAGSTTRVATSFAAATTAGVKSMNGTSPSWTNGGTSETLSHISLWDAASAGNFKLSVALTTPQAWASTNTFTLTSLTLTLSPVAA